MMMRAHPLFFDLTAESSITDMLNRAATYPEVHAREINIEAENAKVTVPAGFLSNPAYIQGLAKAIEDALAHSEKTGGAPVRVDTCAPC